MANSPQKINLELTRDQGFILMGMAAARQYEEKEVSKMMHDIFTQLKKQVLKNE